MYIPSSYVVGAVVVMSKALKIAAENPMLT
jgi:hypothetical protein